MSSTSEGPELNAAAIIRVLNEHGVEYVVIGAFAAIAQQAPIPATRDIDVTPNSAHSNLAKLSSALNELDAKIRTEGVPLGLPFSHDATSLSKSTMWNLVCRYGDLDISFFPSGFDDGYRSLVANAHQVSVDGTVVVIADLADVILSKEAAGRPKDLAVLPALLRELSKRKLRGPES